MPIIRKVWIFSWITWLTRTSYAWLGETFAIRANERSNISQLYVHSKENVVKCVTWRYPTNLNIEKIISLIRLKSEWIKRKSLKICHVNWAKSNVHYIFLALLVRINKFWNKLLEFWSLEINALLLIWQIHGITQKEAKIAA